MIDIIYLLASLIFTLIIYFFISRDWNRHTKNIPYIPSKKKNLFYRIFFGLMAGIHYLHFVGTYDHKKYNTQVFTPKTLECYIGIFFASVLLLAYLVVAWYLKDSIGISGLLILLIPIITNIISFIQTNHKLSRVCQF